MNRTYTTSELICIIENNTKFLDNVKELMRTAPAGQNLSELRRMLYNVTLITNNSRSILDQQFLESITTEQLLKDIQRTAV